MNPHTKGPQLVNFCLTPLTKHVECTSIYADNHQVDNLTSQHTCQRERGFRVEHFIRPPVHIVFHFLVPVNIACVVVKPDLTESSVASMTVFASSAIHSTSQQQMTLCSRGSVRGEGALLFLKNRVFERRHHWTVDLSSFASVLGSHMTHTDIVRKSEETFKDVCNIRCLKLCVNYFSGPRPVSLRWIEVWGVLGVSTCQEDTLAAHAAIASLCAEPAMSHTTQGVSVAQQLCQPPVELSFSMDPKAQVHVHHYGEVKQAVQSFPSRSDIAVGTCTHIRELVKKEHTIPDGMGKEKLSTLSPYHFPSQQSPSVLFSQLESKETVSVNNSSSSCGGTLEGDSLLCSNHSGWQGVLSKHDSTSDGKTKTRYQPPYASIVGHTSGSGGAGSNDVMDPLRQTCSHDVVNTSTGRNRNRNRNTSIPDRFLDEITYELMALPMLLPSGHFVDRSTLEKLHHTDTTYARPPSDPFTGVAFSEHTLPQFNVELKQQIDSFLSKHGPNLSHNMSSFGRTLGSATEIALHLSSIQKAETREKRSRDETMSHSDEVCPPLAKRRNPTTTTAEGGKEPSKRQISAVAVADTQNLAYPSPHGTLSSATTSKSVEASQDRMCSHAHEVEVAASLDKELQDLLRD